jgi:large subunit ribosomal protein L4
MAEVPVIGAQGGTTRSLPEEVFGQPFHHGLVHNCVRAELAARRQGTHATKTRGMVSGGGAKPWRQKGTGRARVGSIRSPLWRGGGTVFGPRPRRYLFKVNRKERRAALRSALSLKTGSESLAILQAGAIAQPKVAVAREILGSWLERRPLLVVVGERGVPAELAVRNLPGVEVVAQPDLGVYELMRAQAVVIAEEALAPLIERCGPVKRGSKAEVEGGA